jgi:SAM-dependent methyltransferase
MATPRMNAVFSPPRRCRLCGSARLKVRGTKKGKFKPLVFNFFECRSCSLLFVSPVLGPEIYDDSYYDGHGPDPLVDYASEYTNYALTPRKYEFLDLYRLAKNHLEEKAIPVNGGPIRWLDYGCGAGGLLKFLHHQKTIRVRGKEYAIEVSGFDVGSYADKLKTIDKLKILGRRELENLPSGHFQIITCVEVVEHLPEPLPVFETLARLLGPRGLLLLTTGNLRSPLGKLLGIAFPYCVPEIHVSYFTPFALKYAYERVGLRPVSLRFADGLRFKFLKNIAPILPSGVARILGNSSLLLRALDYLYGISAMPSATKDRPE